MNTLIIGCGMMENELKYAYDHTETTYPIRWIDGGLHNNKDRLLSALQAALDEETGYDRILLAASFCGNAILGLKTRDAELIIPRADDCISVLFGGTTNKTPWIDSYFLTEGWLKSNQTLYAEYQRALTRYGEKRANRIFKAMLANYRRFLLLDTGCYELEPAFESAKHLAETFSKETAVEKASPAYLERLLTGPWSEELFLTVPPHTTIRTEDLFLSGKTITDYPL